MHNIHADNVNSALSEALNHLHVSGIREESRNGTVLVAPTPVLTTYYHPRQRVLFSPMRDANPFFHFMEALWMLGGRDDLEWPLFFNSKFGSFSDDGKTIHGAYGNRWRSWFGFDQLRVLAQHLREQPNSRRAVLTMWSPNGDLVSLNVTPLTNQPTSTLSVGGLGCKDVPCNTHVYLDIRGGALNMTVCCRSNDVLWGAYGANAVHFSMLHEFMAAWVGVDVGVYRQFSNNLHVYTDIFPENKLLALADDATEHDYYNRNHPPIPDTLAGVMATALDQVTVHPLVTASVEDWQIDLAAFFEVPGGDFNWKDPLFPTVVTPMYRAFAAWKKKDYETADEQASYIAAGDWKVACIDWLNRRTEKRNAK